MIPHNFTNAHLGVIKMSITLNVGQAIFIEAVITFLLVLTVFGCVDKNRKDQLIMCSGPMAMGLSITAGLLCAVS